MMNKRTSKNDVVISTSNSLIGKRDTPISLKLLSILLLCLSLILANQSSINLYASIQCFENGTFFTNTLDWQILDSSVDAEIIWQVKERNSHSFPHLGNAATGIVAYHGNVLYWQVEGNCNSNPVIVAVDSISGKENWTFVPGEILNQLFPVSGGYILLGISSMTLVNSEGETVWQQLSFKDIPFREFKTVFEVDGTLLFPTQYDKIYEISLATGQLQRVINSANVMTISEDYSVVEVAGDVLEIKSIGVRKSKFEITPPSDLFENVEMNPLWPYVLIIDDVLLLCFDSTKVIAYDITNGEFLWETQGDVYGVPIAMHNTVVVFSKGYTIEILHPRSGEPLETIALGFQDNNARKFDNRFSLWLAGEGDNLYIRHRDALTLVAIRIDFSKVKK